MSARVFEMMKPIAIEFRRFKTPERLLWAFDEGVRKDAGKTREEWREYEPSVPRKEYVAAMRAEGFWAFCDTKRNVVRYWVAPGTPKWKLVYLLGHEVGHASGKPSRGMVAEEERANTFGAAAESVFRHLAGIKQRR